MFVPCVYVVDVNLWVARGRPQRSNRLCAGLRWVFFGRIWPKDGTAYVIRTYQNAEALHVPSEFVPVVLLTVAQTRRWTRSRRESPCAAECRWLESRTHRLWRRRWAPGTWTPLKTWEANEHDICMSSLRFFLSSGAINWTNGIYDVHITLNCGDYARHRNTYDILILCPNEWHGKFQHTYLYNICLLILINFRFFTRRHKSLL